MIEIWIATCTWVETSCTVHIGQTRCPALKYQATDTRSYSKQTLNTRKNRRGPWRIWEQAWDTRVCQVSNFLIYHVAWSEGRCSTKDFHFCAQKPRLFMSCFVLNASLFSFNVCVRAFPTFILDVYGAWTNSPTSSPLLSCGDPPHCWGSSKKHEPFLSLVSSRWNREADSRRIVFSRDQSRFSYIFLEGGFRNRASSLPRKEAPTDKDRGEAWLVCTVSDWWDSENEGLWGSESRHLLVQCKALKLPNWSALAGFGGVFRCLGSKSGSKGEVKAHV
jgi:hypothetical protein